MKTRSAVVATVIAASLAGSAAGYAADRVAKSSASPSTASTPPAAQTPVTPPTTRPVTTTGVPTTTAEPATATTAPRPSATPHSGPTSRPASTGATSPVPARSRALGVRNLLVANDYLDAGMATARITTAAEGMGQAAISACQSGSPDQAEGLRKIYQGVAATGGAATTANQYVMQFRTETDARRAVGHVDEWRWWCPATENSASPITSVGSSAHQVRLDGEAEGQWWTLRITQGGYTHTELVAVVRLADRVSVVDVQLPSGSTAPDGPTLVRRSAARLG